jgi:hypothetical protein
MIVNVGTIGHVDHRRDVLVVGAGQVASIVISQLHSVPRYSQLRPLDCPVRMPLKKGKGQRKANKANRWK